MLRKYPIGLQSFRSLREGGYVYVDKTEIIHQLVTSGKYYFLSRPRRFGKSLLMDTIEELFKGSTKLFEGLWIEKQWDWSVTNPVIHFNFAEIPYKEVGLDEALNRELHRIARELDIELATDNLKDCFRNLIESAADRYGAAVILIDEYDKPLIDFLGDPGQLEANRAVMKNFYSVLKGRDEHIRFLLLTGVSRFSKVSLFSDLNHLRDISMNGQFDHLAGITQDELETNFGEELDQLRQQDPDILAKIKNWYNGYSWGNRKRVYNPFSLLNFMADHEFNNYWFQTGTPTFFYEMILRNPAMEFPDGEVQAGPEALVDLLDQQPVYGGPGTIDPVTIMFQTGYLTVKAYDAEVRLYTLDFPNREVRESTQIFLLSAYSQGTYSKVRPNVLQIAQAFRTDDMPRVMQLIDTLFAHIPNTLWTGATERFYHAIIHNTFGLLDIFMESERNYAGIRPDLTVFTKTHIYVLEFKLDSSAAAALEQVTGKDYFRPFAADPRTKVALGINFSSERRGVAEYLSETISE